MREKLCKYACTMLPGGIYWEPDLATKSVLRQLKPTNDLCESILGLNDYLTTAIPNLHQLSRSNLIQVKKNRTIPWFQQLPKSQQHSIIDLAVRRRAYVAEQFKHEVAMRREKRCERMAQDNCQRDALRQKVKEQEEQLASMHVIATTEELKETLSDIESQPLSSRRKSDKKRALIRQQVNIRKRVLKQSIKIPFMYKGRQRSLKDLVKDLTEFLSKSSPEGSALSHDLSPEFLVGKEILHKFNVSGEEKWYNGCVLGYNAVTHLHEVAYDKEEEHSFFNLLEDFRNGDLIING